MFYTPLEIETIKEDIDFTSKDVENRINKLLEDGDCETNVDELKRELERIQKEPLETIEEDFSKKEFFGYCIDYIEGKVHKAQCDDLFFEYDNDSHKLYLACFTWQ